MEPIVIFEDQRILVMNKPPGLVVNRAQSVKQTTLQDWVEQHLSQDAEYKADLASDSVFGERSGMVHRLDKDTSGVIVFAKRASVMHELLRLFKAREVEKTYWALVHGKLPDQKGVISAPIERHPIRRDIFTVTDEGRPSITEFQVLQEFSGVQEAPLRAEMERTGRERQYRNLHKMLKIYEAGFSLVELHPKTGRTHQIRVHLKFLHRPIVGDERYVGEKHWKLDQLWCKRQWLHARELKLPGYEKFVAELTPDLELVKSFLLP